MELYKTAELTVLYGNKIYGVGLFTLKLSYVIVTCRGGKMLASMSLAIVCVRVRVVISLVTLIKFS